MIRSVSSALLLLCALAAGRLVADGAGTLRRYELPNLDTLELVLPAGWQDTVDEPPGGVPLTIQFRPVEGASFEIFVTLESPEQLMPEVRDPNALRNAVRDAASRIQPQAVEETIELRHLQGADGIGFYFSATDRVPLAGDFRFTNQGALQVGDLTLWFMILTNEGQEAVVVDALAMLQTAVHRGTGLDQR